MECPNTVHVATLVFTSYVASSLQKTEKHFGFTRFDADFSTINRYAPSIQKPHDVHVLNSTQPYFRCCSAYIVRRQGIDV